MTKALQCQYSHLHLTLHGDSAVRKGVPCSKHPLIQDRSYEMQLYK